MSPANAYLVNTISYYVVFAYDRHQLRKDPVAFEHDIESVHAASYKQIGK